MQISEAERRVLLDVARGVPPAVAVPDLLASPLLTAVAAYLAVEESWSTDDSARVLDSIERHIPGAQGATLAALASRGAILDTWWIRTGESIDAWDRAIGWANVSTTVMPEWLTGWLILFDGYRYRGEVELARTVAHRTELISDPSPMADELDWAIEVLFGGRIGWTTASAQYLESRA